MDAVLLAVYRHVGEQQFADEQVVQHEGGDTTLPSRRVVESRFNV